MIFETERIRIRNLNENDIEKMICYRSDERCNKFQRYEDFSYEYMHSFIKKYEHSIFLSLEDEQHYAITLKNDSSIVGDFSVFYTESDNCFTLGITIAPEIQRQGIAYEVLESTVKRIIEKYPTMDIVALIEKENAGSIALFQKLGFIEECYADSIQSWVYCIYGRNE